MDTALRLPDNLPDEPGYEAWLRYTPQPPARRAELAPLARVRADAAGDCVEAARSEWARALSGWGVGKVVDCPGADPDGAGLTLALDPALPAEGWRAEVDSKGSLRIAGGCERGVLYGVMTAIARLQRGAPPAELAGESDPVIPLRLLNHWDNLVADPVHGSIERVKGGDTLFDWTDLARPNPRYEDYARLLASVGINGTCVNNVNADPEILAEHMLDGLAALAAILRRWGVRLFVSVNYGSPVFLGGLATADPLDPAVERWWRDKVDGIYALIPDFGGFVVKADSEGQPGPGEYGHGHVEGSRVLARALAAHGGLLLWRAFVYGSEAAARAPHARAAADRATHASHAFMQLDGQFDDNVILQVKCSAIDFQVWEPAHALFGHMPNTRLALELCLTKEYSGQDTHLGWEGPYFHHILNFDARGRGAGGTIADIVGGRAAGGRPGAIAAAANISNARNWFGHLLHGASLHSYGRLAWAPTADPVQLLAEYTGLMFGREAGPEVASIMAPSLDTVAGYTMPMGMTYISEFLHHYEPDPWENHAGAGITAAGIGTDRTVATGSGYAGLYPPEFAALVEFPATCPTRFLLYFHHLPWGHVLPDGETLIQQLYDSYFDGVEAVRRQRAQWRALLGRIDLARWAHVFEKLSLQLDHADRWRDLVCRFLIETSGIPDQRGRFISGSPSPHNRVRTAFWKALEDYHARVAREREALRAVAR